MWFDDTRGSLALACVLAIAACAPPARVTPVEPPRPADWAASTLRGMTLRQKVAQLLMPRIGGEYVPVGAGAYDRMSTWVRELGVGGVIVTVGPPLEMAVKLNMLQEMAAVPLLVTADMEHGPGQVLNAGTILPYGLENGGGTRFPPLMGLGATGEERFAWELGRITALEGRAAGVHVTFAPVVDVNNNPANPIINTRSYGADPALVSRMAAAHIRGIQEHGMLATAKHFPGHGDTGTDSHVHLPLITVDKTRVDRVELPPYRAAFAAGVAAVMSAHIAFPALTGDSVPATLNPRLLSGLLRDELGFDGIVFTDALDMGAIVEGWGSGQSAVMALTAGADVLLQMMPDDVPVVIDAVVDAVQRGELTESRIEQSALRVLRAKQQLGLHENARVDIERIPRIVGAPEHQRIAAEAAQRSITVVRNQNGLLPLRAQRVLSIIYTDDFDPVAGRAFQRELATGVSELSTVAISGAVDATRLASISARADSADVVLFSPFIRVVAGKEGIGIAPHVAEAVAAMAARRPVIITAFGNPYVLQQFPAIGTYVLAWAPWEPAQTAAARALLGRAPVQGRLPIPIPPYHQVGEGVQIGAVSAQ
ncbi:MAG TPA: glycoside hydrolase family 3 protein [Longimicrobiales bacterium]